MIKTCSLHIVLCSCLLLGACGSWWLPRAHKIDIQQGNVLSDVAVASISEGMSRAEVVTLLGRPVAQNPGNPARWDYIYSLNKAGDKPNAKRLTVFFESDRIVQIEKDGFDTTQQ